MLSGAGPRSWIRWLFRVAGLALSVASLIFVGLKIVESSGPLTTDFARTSFLATILLGALLYALLSSLVGFGWITLARGLGPDGNLRSREGLIVYGRSQIMKYLPSNVLHIVGRYGLGRQIGASPAALLFSIAAESILLVIAASMLAILFGLPLVLKFAAEFQGGISRILVLATLLILLGGSLWWFREDLFNRRLVIAMLAAFLLYLCFFLLNGSIVLALAVHNAELQRPMFIFGVTAAA